MYIVAIFIYVFCQALQEGRKEKVHPYVSNKYQNKS